MRYEKVMQQHVGLEGEGVAAAYLETKHYEILERNYRSKTGEVDIVCLDQSDSIKGVQLVFVEVKTRRGAQFGEPAEAVTDEKLNRIRRAAEVYMMENQLDDVPCRFDVIGILYDKEGTHIEHLVDVVDY